MMGGEIEIYLAAGLKWSMEPPKQPSSKILPFALPQDTIEAQLEAWVAGIVKSNEDLVAALERLRGSYEAMIAGESVTESEELLVAVEEALMKAEKAKNVVWRSNGFACLATMT